MVITKRNRKMAKMKVLSSARKRALDSVPKLTKEATVGYFTLDVETKKILNKMQSDVAKVGYLVSKAYFQAKGRFFESSRFIDADVKRARKVLSVKSTVDLSNYTSETASRHKKQILVQYNWQAYIQSTSGLLALQSHLYSIRELKRIDQGIGQRSLKQNANILEVYGERFTELLPVYKKMGLTDAAIKHFSDAIYLGNNDEIRRLKNDNKQSLYYLSFIHDQFHKRHDFAADALLKVIKQFTNKAKNNERTKRDEQHVSTLEANKSIVPKMLIAYWSSFFPLPKISNFLMRSAMSEHIS